MPKKKEKLICIKCPICQKKMHIFFFAQKSFDKHLYYRGRNILDDFREAYYWLWQNTADNATVMSWWDYGYQIAGMANRTTLVDNNTWNNSHIALVGKAMSSNESRAYEIMTELNVDYVLVIFGGKNMREKFRKFFPGFFSI